VINLSKIPWFKALAILGVALLIVVYLVIPDRQTLTPVLDEALAQKNEALIQQNNALDALLLDSRAKTDSLHLLITSKNQIIHSLKSQIDEKINRINALSTAELEQFFTRLKTDSLPH